ncbi:MAG: protein translocase SEC61 complex subunit gamma [Nanoarchaeota archaeon]|jgi:protein transport protein SEC61 subunit gamma-like protein|nr:protein translocase SEC61 complex subunit gamma [Nanoarchaeota archaeon]|tara:strand:+ start:8828 stop:9025 length:198 start_codon:yes stop_codon:yes gene_type:complete
MDNLEYNPTLYSRFKSFILESKRVFRVTKKPTMEEYKAIVKVSAIGIAIIGILGFLIQILWQMIK